MLDFEKFVDYVKNDEPVSMDSQRMIRMLVGLLAREKSLMLKISLNDITEIIDELPNILELYQSRGIPLKNLALYPEYRIKNTRRAI